MDEEKLEPLVAPPDGLGHASEAAVPASSPLDASPAGDGDPYPRPDHRDTMSPSVDDDDDLTSPTSNVVPRRRCAVLRTCCAPFLSLIAGTPTLAFILGPMVLFIIVTFLSAALLPPSAGTVDPEAPGGEVERATGRPTGSPTGKASKYPASWTSYRRDYGLEPPEHDGPVLAERKGRGPKDPRGVHISLTGTASEMHVQFLTGEGGTPIVEFGKKSDLLLGRHGVSDLVDMMDTHRMHDQTAKVARRTARSLVKSGGKSLTKVKGTSATYTASDMCQSPAIDASSFGDPGHVHTVKLVGLAPSTEYVYRVGLGYGQGVNWEEKYRKFRSSPAKGRGKHNNPDGEAAVTFLALSDQGTAVSNPGGGSGKGGPAAAPAGTSPAASPSVELRDGTEDGTEDKKKKKKAEVNLLDPSVRVTNLITSLISNRTIASVHHFGDVSYADGVTSVWDAYHDLVEPYASAVPVMYGVGNHEYDHTSGGLDDRGKARDPSGAATADGFQPEWGEGSFENRGGECGVALSRRFAVPNNENGIFWYSYDQSIVHTIMLSSEHNLTSGSDQYEWLESDLKSVNRTITPWLVVEMHRPMYNSVRYWGGATVALGMRSEFEDLLYEYRADLVLSGHYHSYLRTCDGLYRGNCQSGGPTYVTVGTGGAPLDEDGVGFIPNGWTEVYDNRRHGVGRAGAYNASAMLWEIVAADDREESGVVTDSVWIRRNRGP